MKTLKQFKNLLLLLTLVLAVSGCTTTVAPTTTSQQRASFDTVADVHGNLQNSGVLGFTNHLAIITPSARARYTNLVARYGGRFTPPLVGLGGLTLADTNTFLRFHADTLWLIDKQHLDQWATMNRWANNPAAVKPP